LVDVCCGFRVALREHRVSIGIFGPITAELPSGGKCTVEFDHPESFVPGRGQVAPPGGLVVRMLRIGALLKTQLEFPVRLFQALRRFRVLLANVTVISTESRSSGRI
jgi:hypothetical protein